MWKSKRSLQKQSLHKLTNCLRKKSRHNLNRPNKQSQMTNPKKIPRSLQIKDLRNQMRSLWKIHRSLKAQIQYKRKKNQKMSLQSLKIPNLRNLFKNLKTNLKSQRCRNQQKTKSPLHLRILLKMKHRSLINPFNLLKLVRAPRRTRPSLERTPNRRTRTNHLETRSHRILLKMILNQTLQTPQVAP